MLTDAERETINRYIAKELMRLPLAHEMSTFGSHCVHCQMNVAFTVRDEQCRSEPDYTSPDTARKVLDEAEAAAIAEVGHVKYVQTLLGIIQSERKAVWTAAVTATAEQRSRAIFNAREGASCGEGGSMTNHEINWYIYERIMGKTIGEMFMGVPDYCSDDSPRRLLNEVVDTVIERTGINSYCLRMFETVFEPHERHEWYGLLFASAEQIARVCVEAHRSQDAARTCESGEGGE